MARINAVNHDTEEEKESPDTVKTRFRMLLLRFCELLPNSANNPLNVIALSPRLTVKGIFY